MPLYTRISLKNDKCTSKTKWKCGKLLTAGVSGYETWISKSISSNMPQTNLGHTVKMLIRIPAKYELNLYFL